VQFHPGHADGQRVVHLTSHSLLVETLCGEAIELDREPDCAVICEECHTFALAAGGAPDEWTVTVATFELRAAA
jgi:hypothetical protein